MLLKLPRMVYWKKWAAKHECELEVQRPIKRAELTAFLCLLGVIIGPTTAHVDNKGLVHWSESEGRRLVDSDLGGGSQDVNGIHPAPDIHEHFTIHKGYGIMRTPSRTISTTLSTL